MHPIQAEQLTDQVPCNCSSIVVCVILCSLHLYSTHILNVKHIVISMGNNIWCHAHTMYRMWCLTWVLSFGAMPMNAHDAVQL
jgi:uncharacterized membrane protein